SPLLPASLDAFPASYMPGSIGYVRPQLRVEYNQPFGDGKSFIIQGAIAQAIQTLRLSNSVVARETGVPDGQLRLAFGDGALNPLGKRKLEVGVSAHVGQRRAQLLVPPFVDKDFTTWSFNVDASVALGSRTRLEGEYFVGSVLGDYYGGILS